VDRHMKRFYIGWLVVLVLVVAVGSLYANDMKSFFLKDQLLENGLGTTKPVVSITDSEKTKNVTIKLNGEIADDGGFVYDVLNKNGKKIGSFSYKPWLEKNPLYYELETGDVILGENVIYKSVYDRIENLCPTLDNALLDYAVHEDQIAFIGTKSGDSTVYVYIQNISGGEPDLVDSFKYPEYEYPANVFIGYDQSGNLYYDYCESGKPAIRSFDPRNRSSNTVLLNAMNPQVSPDGKYMVFESTDGFNISQQTYSELTLFDLKDKNIIAKLDGSRRVFWAGDYLAVKSLDGAKLGIYDLNNKGVKVKDILSPDLTMKVDFDNGKFTIKAYKFQDNTFSKKIYMESL